MINPRSIPCTRPFSARSFLGFGRSPPLLTRVSILARPLLSGDSIRVWLDARPIRKGLSRTSLMLSIAAVCAVTFSADAQPCELYPIALSVQTLSNSIPGSVLSDVFNGTRPGNFGWLTWAGGPSEPTLVASLTPPGDSSTYVNPDDASDRQISVGDWIQGKPGVANTRKIRDALERLQAIDITVPVWNEMRGEGEHVAYRVSAFARVRVMNYDLPGQNHIIALFLGYVSCGVLNQKPVVDAGPDQAIALPSLATLNGSITDDGLPMGGTLRLWWSAVSGAGTVTFANSNAVTTTAIFSTPGTYLLQLTATDTLLTNSDEII